ncbi:hypothetical protein B0H19DRAFT_1273331 [Mycena capillaripes]|nr:hypothetical protein B0H19DRAFT_1273331 [Mycena capillaripes]
MRIQKLDLTAPQSTSDWARSLLNHQLFLSITHLSFYQIENGVEAPKPPDWNDWSQLASLPALTHLALSETLSRGILPRAMESCSRLVLAATIFWMRIHGEREKSLAFTHNLPIADPRVVVLRMVILSGADWKIGANGGDDFWVRADTFVTRKRKGEIESTCYLLDETG